MPARSDPLASVSQALAQGTAPDLEAALSTCDDALATAGTSLDARRALACRAEVLLRLGRRDEASTAYADALARDLSNGEATIAALGELLDRFGALEAVVDLVHRAVGLHPGRRWQLEPLAAQARARLALERTAPLSGAHFDELRRAVAGRLASMPPCDHGDDTRPITREVVRGLGLDVAPVLDWLAELGACCCDCSVASIRGPREERRSDVPARGWAAPGAQ